MDLSPEERFFDKVELSNNSCWLWIAGKTPDGYGKFLSYLAHRWLFERLHGPIPTGLQLDHLCRVRNCVNPDHLEIVTPRENIARGISGNKTHCINGHPYNSANTYTYYRNGNKHRYCRICALEATRRYNNRKRSGRSTA